MEAVSGRDRFGRTLRAVRARRRLSQLELAVRAGTSQRYISFVERGISVPGRGLVVRLAESLDLPLRERNDLLFAGGYAPAYAETDLGDPALRPIVEALQHVLDGHLPYPAIVISRVGDIAATNAAFAVLTEGASAAVLEEPVNIYRLALHTEGMAPRIRNFAQWGRHVVVGLQRAATRNPDPRLEALIRELEPCLPPLPRDGGPDQLGFAVPLQLDSPQGELRLISAITSLATATDVAVADLRLEAFLPADASTTAALAALRERAAQSGRQAAH
jgi:transcriptional regulator with XRE-family HTH domain